MPRLHELDLESDWERVVRSPILRTRFVAWRAEQPALHRFEDAAAVVRFMRSDDGRRTEKDAVLCALLACARTDVLGARMVLEVIRPGLLNLCRRLARDARERDEIWSMILLSVWEGIRTYPLDRRRRRVAANLLLGVLRPVLGEAARESEWRAIVSPESVNKQRAAVTEPDDGDVDRLLSNAIKVGALSEHEAELILASRIDGVDLHELARAAGTPYNTMKLRRQRAERRLLVFLGYRPVPRGRQNRPSSLARVAGVGP